MNKSNTNIGMLQPQLVHRWSVELCDTASFLDITDNGSPEKFTQLINSVDVDYVNDRLVLVVTQDGSDEALYRLIYALCKLPKARIILNSLDRDGSCIARQHFICQAIEHRCVFDYAEAGALRHKIVFNANVSKISTGTKDNMPR